MTPERWRQITELFHAARELDPARRQAFLADACRADAGLRQELDAMLAGHDGAGAFGETPMFLSGSGLEPGFLFGSYRIEYLLGAGGMGEVYRARDTTLGRDVAIKILPRAFATDPDRLARFEREARMLAALNHPHIGAIYGLESIDGTPALVLELVEGDTLAARLAKGSLPLAHAVMIATQIIEALQVAHERGIIHRDLKPANIKITPTGAVKVLDFGLAKAAAGNTSGSDLSQPATLTAGDTRDGVILGTAAYMSPEQARGQAVDERTDIWAFGCVLYEMLTARIAFDGVTTSDSIAAILERDPDWRALPDGTPVAVRRLLRRCLEKHPAKRLHDIADARLELDEKLSELEARDDVHVSHWRPYAAWVVAILALLAIALSAFALSHRSQDLPVMRFEVATPPTVDPTSFALSPDGLRLVFVATTDGESKLWLRPLDQTTAQPLAATNGATFPFWSPDSRSVGFFAGGQLKRLDLGGGTPQPIAEAAAPQGGTWSRDDVILFGGSERLMRVPASGGALTNATFLAAGEGSHRFPQFLPDGRHFLFFVQSGPKQGIYIGSLDSTDARQLVTSDTAGAYAAGYLLTVRRGVLVAIRLDVARGRVSGEPIPVAQQVGGVFAHGAFSVSPTGLLAYRSSGATRRQLVWFDRRGTKVATLGLPEGQANPELSPDDQRVAVVRFERGNEDIWLIDASNGAASRFTFDPGTDGAAVWAPDGRRLMFGSNRNGAFDLFTKPANGARDEELVLTSSSNKAPADWSADGLHLLYESEEGKAGSRLELWTLALDGTRKPLAFLQEKFDVDEAQFSPDGHWVAYRSNESAQPEIYVRPFPGPGGQREISRGGGSSPRWRRDGKELFYVAPDGKLMAVPIGPSSEEHGLEFGTPVALFSTRLGDPGLPKPQYAVGRDGQRFLMNMVDEASPSPLTVVQNWMAGLTK